MTNFATNLHCCTLNHQHAYIECELKKMSQLYRPLLMLIINYRFVNGERYREVISNFSLTKIQKLDLHVMWFQQDGATCHTAQVARDLLRGELNSPSKSCDLTPFNYLFGAILKLMSIQTSPLQLMRWKTTLEYLIARYWPKYWKKYAKIKLIGWTI